MQIALLGKFTVAIRVHRKELAILVQIAFDAADAITCLDIVVTMVPDRASSGSWMKNRKFIP